MAHVIYGIARTLEQAERIVSELQTAGFPDDSISVLLPDKTGTSDFAHEKGTKSPEGATAGASAGAVLGGGLGLLAGIGTLAIPGLGPLIAAGPILAALSGAAVGATVGGLAGAMIGMGVPEYEAKRYEGKIRDGNVLLSVHTIASDQKQLAKKIFESCRAEDIGTTGLASVPRSRRMPG